MKFGMQVIMTALPNYGKQLGEIMLKASSLVERMKGCQIYIVQVALNDEDKILITEVWESEDAHKASLSSPSVKEMIMKARPLIADIENYAASPLGGKGIN